MTETNAERLERIRQNFTVTLKIVGRQNKEVLFGNDVEWLIEQVERAQELEMKHENSGSIFSRQNQQALIDENKKLREALEELVDKAERWERG